MLQEILVPFYISVNSLVKELIEWKGGGEKSEALSKGIWFAFAFFSLKGVVP
jgi:hypothetical protein